MTKMVIKKKIIPQKLAEATSDNIFDTGISKEELRTRRISIERVIRKINEAIKKATSLGDTATLEQLNSELEFYQHLYDHAEDYGAGKTGESSGGSETPSGDTEETSPDSTLTGDLEATEDSKDSPEESDASDSKGDSGSSEETEKESEEESGGSEDGEDEEVEGDGAEESEEDKDSEDEKDSAGSDKSDSESSEEESEEEGDGSGTEKKELDDEDLFADEEGDTDDTSEDEETDSDGDEGSSGTAESEEEDPMDEPDDYPLNPKPVIKDGKILIDPFKNRPSSDKGMDEMPPELETETIFEAATRILDKLYGDARKGALAGLEELLKGRGYTESLSTKQTLTETLPTKTLREYSDEELSELIRNTMAIVDKVVEVDYSDDIEDRAKELEKVALDPTTRMAMNKEDEDNVKRDAKKASESENALYSQGKKLGGLSEFTRNLYQAVADQVEESEEDEESWAALDRRHEDDPSIIKKGIIKDDVPNEEIPTINVYFDQSGSWSNEEVEIGKRAISTINEFHERGEIQLNIFYMSAGGIFTTSEAARAHPGAEGWADALQHIRDTKVKNVIVLSDRDLDYFEYSNRPTGDNGVTYVDGCVWWLWKNGSVSKKALKELRGGKSNYAYSFPCR